jgi:hypothetical protein
MKEYWIFVKGIFYLYWNDHVISVPGFILNHPPVSGMKPTWPHCIQFFSMLLNMIFKHFIKNFCIYIHQGNWATDFFFCYVLIQFWVLLSGKY